MSWYRTGTVTVTNGSKSVTGVGTLWASSVNVGDAFALVDANGNPTGAWYEVETVTSNTKMVLKQSYAGSTGSNKQYCVFNLVGNMTTPSFAQRLAQFFDQFQNLVDLPTTTPTASSIPIADSGGKIDSAWIKDASATVKGVVELATAAEATAGNDTTRAITPSVSGSRITFATTSTDDATSATAAPLKSAGGLAVAKDGVFGGHILRTKTVGGVVLREQNLMILLPGGVLVSDPTIQGLEPSQVYETPAFVNSGSQLTRVTLTAIWHVEGYLQRGSVRREVLLRTDNQIYHGTPVYLGNSEHLVVELVNGNKIRLTNTHTTSKLTYLMLFVHSVGTADFSGLKA